MDDWEQDFWQVITYLKEEFEEFCQGVGDIVENLAGQLTEDVSTTMEGLHQVIADTEFFCQEFLDSNFDEDFFSHSDLSLDDLNSDDGIEFLVINHLEPNLENHPACIGCRHYHGQVYRGNLLVCGMHPYGWEDLNCPDWEKSR